MLASTSKSFFHPPFTNYIDADCLWLPCVFVNLEVHTQYGRLRASTHGMHKVLQLFDSEQHHDWQQARRGGDAICLKTGKNQSYTNGFCHGNMRTREAGWKIDHRLRTFQLNVSFVFFSIFIFHFLEHDGEFFWRKIAMMYAEGPLKSRKCTKEEARSFSFPF